MAITPDSRWLATGSGDRTARLWDLTSKDPSATAVVLRGHDDVIGYLAVSPDGRWLATASPNCTTRVWNLTVKDAAAEPMVLRGHTSSVTCLAFSPDSRWVLTGSRDGTARIWDLTAEDAARDSGRIAWTCIAGRLFDGRCEWALAGHRQHRRYGASVGFDRRGSERPAVVLHGGGGSFLCLAMSPDGGRLAAASNDQKIWLWDLTAEGAVGAPVVLNGEKVRADCLQISTDGRWLAAASENGSVRMWSLVLDEILGLARQAAGRELSPEEVEQYLLP